MVLKVLQHRSGPRRFTSWTEARESQGLAQLISRLSPDPGAVPRPTPRAGGATGELWPLDALLSYFLKKESSKVYFKPPSKVGILRIPSLLPSPS